MKSKIGWIIMTIGITGVIKFLNNNSVFPLGLYLMQVYKKNINNYLSK